MINTIKKFLDNDKIQDGFELVAKILFLVYAMFGFNSYFYGHKIVSFFMWPALLMCVFAVLWRAIIFKRYINMPGIILSILFIVSHCLSTVLNISYGLKDNVILAVYLAVYLLLFYVYPTKKEPGKVKKDFTIISLVYVIYAALGSVISVVMFAKGYSTVDYFGLGGYEVVVGFRWGRLWGIFLDPNRGALMMLLAILLVIYLVLNAKNKLYKSVLVVSILPMFLYIVFSDSRTAMVSVFFALIAGCVVWVIVNPISNSKVLVRNIFIGLLISVTLALSPLATKKAYNSYVSSLNEVVTENFVENSTEAPVENTTQTYLEPTTEASGEHVDDTTSVSRDEYVDDTTSVSQSEQNSEVSFENDVEEETLSANDNTSDFQTIDRDYDLSQDISNRRFDIWKSGAEMFVVNPIFGYSYNGIRLYALEHMPETYIVNNGVNLFSNFHNEALNVLASQGVIGFLICSILVILILVLIFKKLKYVQQENKKDIAIMTAIVVGLAAGAMFLSLMVYTFCALSPMFWLCLGYMVYLLKNAKIDTKME